MAPDNPTRRQAPTHWQVDELYEKFVEDPASVSKGWQDFFTDYRGPDPVAAPDNGATAPAAKKESAPTPAAAPTEKPAAATATEEDTTGGAAEATPLRGAAARIVTNMEASLSVPVATSVRDVPAKLLEVNRKIVNNHLQRTRGGKVSFTHFIAWALIKASQEVPAMRRTYTEKDGKPAVMEGGPFGLGLAVDVEGKNGSRSLMVPVIQNADDLTFSTFLDAYEEMVRKVRSGKLEPSMFAGNTITLTNPGGIGTVHSVPRLMEGQAAIIGVGAITFPTAYEAADPRVIAEAGVSKTITLTSTYDHRVIQGAESGMFLKRVHELLVGGDNFFEECFAELQIPYSPAVWVKDNAPLDTESHIHKHVAVNQLVNMHRVRGHLIADLDPLGQGDVSTHTELDPTSYDLSIWDLDREFAIPGLAGGKKLPFGKILGYMRDAYCRTVGIEYMHIMDPEKKQWIQERVEGADHDMEPADQEWIAERLNAAEAFESFLHTKYVGQKRFGLEGGESLIPLLSALCESAADDAEVTDIVMGMAHRGRLNVLANIMNKPFEKIFGEFEGHLDPGTVQGSGDVKYHLGQHSDFPSRRGGSVHLQMPPNPSHLEAVNPVVEGMSRALQDASDLDNPAMPVLLHGDAAFAGQGVVAETLNLSKLDGYQAGGTVHVVINNQVGFTTNPIDARSSHYATDVAKMIQAPVFHVNGDDPEACVRVARLAYEWRQAFHEDVVIDMVCYRRHGHNEADDPSLTQPVMYAKIDHHRSVRKLYTERLVRRGDITIEKAGEFLQGFEEELKRDFDQAKAMSNGETPQSIRPPEQSTVLPHVDTGVSRDILDRVAANRYQVPDDFSRHPKLDRIFDRGAKLWADGTADWALGETFAIGSLLLEGKNVRLAGQDAERATFSHRHAVLVDYETGQKYTPMHHLGDDQGRWSVYDSLLSEYAALGFEYGYSTVAKDTLTIWEAQFGDFVNGAQIIIDQFIVAAEDKWGDTSGLVMLLPHGYEGQGPEHSSARLERFLTLCAEDNIQVVNATTAAQLFHVLRRQMHRDVARPLVIMTPKSLLRSENAHSPADDFTSGSFAETIDDTNVADASAVTTVVLSSGKVAYDFMKQRDERDAKMAVVRVEQLYPWPRDQVAEILERYPNATDIVWGQEEPANMGPWPFVRAPLERILERVGGGRTLRYAARGASASPATGQHAVHEQEQQQLYDDLFDGVK